jgi:hypothetical protein
VDYKLNIRTDYAGKLLDHKAHIQIQYYTRRQIESIYPYKNFSIVGEVGNQTGVQNGAAENLDGQPLPVYKERTYNMLTESIVGYTAVDNHIYLAVIKNVLIRRIFVFVLILALACVGVVIGKNYYNWF